MNHSSEPLTKFTPAGVRHKLFTQLFFWSLNYETRSKKCQTRCTSLHCVRLNICISCDVNSLEFVRLFHLIDNTPQALRAENQRVILSYFTTFHSDICPRATNKDYTTVSRILHVIFKPSLVSLSIHCGHTLWCVNHDILHFVWCCKSLDIVCLFVQLITSLTARKSKRYWFAFIPVKYLYVHTCVLTDIAH